MIRISSRPEIAFVLLLVQVSFWLLAALSALIFAIPMPAMGLYVVLTIERPLVQRVGRANGSGAAPAVVGSTS